MILTDFTQRHLPLQQQSWLSTETLLALRHFFSDRSPFFQNTEQLLSLLKKFLFLQCRFLRSGIRQPWDLGVSQFANHISERGNRCFPLDSPLFSFPQDINIQGTHHKLLEMTSKYQTRPAVRLCIQQAGYSTRQLIQK